jgi:cytidyltransferase-like protein
MTAVRTVVVEASLDNLKSDDVRFLEEAAALGPVHVRVPSDEVLAARNGAPPLFPAAERLFLAESLRFVASAEIVDRPLADVLDELGDGVRIAVREEEVDLIMQAAAEAAGIGVHVVPAADRAGFPVPAPDDPLPGMPRVVITGCYDWLHSGHIRFFMDAAAHGALYAVVGSDRNVELLKGPGHPLQREEERRYMVGAVKSVHRCLVSSGSGWMDAEPEIAWIRPTHYVVNEDGDQPDKRDFCREQGIEYVVLKRVPHAGLPARSSTALRGF